MIHPPLSYDLRARAEEAKSAAAAARRSANPLLGGTGGAAAAAAAADAKQQQKEAGIVRATPYTLKANAAMESMMRKVCI